MKDNKKNILIVINGFEIGGAQNMVFEMLKCINRQEFEVNVLCYGACVRNSLTEKLDKIQKIKYLGITRKITPLTIIKVMREISKYKPDIVHAHLGGVVFAVLWGLLHHKPVIVTVHTKPEKAFPKRIIPYIEKGIYRNIVQLVAVSKENQHMITQYFGIRENKCVFINNGIDIRRYYRQAHEIFTFINVGRQDDNKNQISILRCFDRLHSENSLIKLYLVGDGERHKTLIQQAQELGLSDCVIFTGNVGNTEKYYAMSDCYVQASYREALPLTALEAMASKLPIIATDVGGMKDIVRDDNGFLVVAGDEEEMFLRMRDVLEMSEVQRESYGRVSYDLIQEYSAERMTQKYEQLYKKRILSK